MFNQRNYRKRIKKISKARMDWHKLEKAQKALFRINQHQIRINEKQIMLNEHFDARLCALELAQQQEKRGLYQRFRAWLIG